LNFKTYAQSQAFNLGFFYDEKAQSCPTTSRGGGGGAIFALTPVFWYSLKMIGVETFVKQVFQNFEPFPANWALKFKKVPI
jgi:hypothetical protein